MDSFDGELRAGVRLIVLNLPEDEGEGLGFRLTRTLWDPYPWVHDVTSGSRADSAGLTTGDCLLQADGKDLLGLPVGQVAGLIRGNGASHGVSLLVWNCGVDPKDDPELLWSAGGGSRGEKSRRALAGVVKALSCCVCAATAANALNCARSHLYCEGCWTRLERCALCREPLPPKESPYAKNLVAEQVFEAIATEYEIKDPAKKTQKTLSAYNTPNRSPNVSPSPRRKGQYQLSMMNRNRFQSSEKYSSDPNIRRSLLIDCHKANTKQNSVESSNTGNCSCQCQKESGSVENVSCQKRREINCNDANNCKCDENVQRINTDETDCCNGNVSCNNVSIQHKLVARLRQACSLADLQNFAIQSCHLSKSLSNINSNEQSDCNGQQSTSMDNLKTNNSCDTPVYLLSPPPIYVLACDHQ
ncbi:unnamed protein product [Colias eurytheme]|nr:unnamed protein product [Colias eurytheme]